MQSSPLFIGSFESTANQATIFANIFNTNRHSIRRLEFRFKYALAAFKLLIYYILHWLSYKHLSIFAIYTIDTLHLDYYLCSAVHVSQQTVYEQ